MNNMHIYIVQLIIDITTCKTGQKPTANFENALCNRDNIFNNLSIYSVL